MRRKFDETKKQLDEEMFEKANLADRGRRADDEYKFKVHLLETQLEEVTSRKEVEITEMDSKLQVRC